MKEPSQNISTQHSTGVSTFTLGLRRQPGSDIPGDYIEFLTRRCGMLTCPKCFYKFPAPFVSTLDAVRGFASATRTIAEIANLAGVGVSTARSVVLRHKLPYRSAKALPHGEGAARIRALADKTRTSIEIATMAGVTLAYAWRVIRECDLPHKCVQGIKQQ